jgi:hypothetical protein
MNTDLQRYVQLSNKLETGDIDWEAASRAGLSEDEKFILTYFSDIESQTFRYLRMLMGMRIAFKPAVAAFLTTWNYEEFYHGFALGRLLAECGSPLEEDRLESVKGNSRLNEWLEAIFAPTLSKIFPSQFPAVYLAFGAIQEMTTLRGYESLQEKTSNPGLRILAERIAKQERRHFAWYFNNARGELEKSPFARRMTRALLQLNWVPVGAGVKPPEDVFRLFSILFPGAEGDRLVEEIDAKMGTLPGLQGVRLMRRYFEDARSRFGAPALATASAQG